MKDRIRHPGYEKRVITPRQAQEYIKDGFNVATSGFTPSGYPKAIPLALANRVKETKEKLKINLYTGASVGDELDGALADNSLINKRFPYQTDNSLRKSINRGEVLYGDIHLSHFPQQLRYGFYGNIDVGIIEGVAITEDGHLIPSTSVGISPTIAEKADKLLIEINTSQPLELEGLHDIYQPLDPPNREPIPLKKADDRIGESFIRLDPKKVVGIVITDIPDNVRPFAPIDETSKKMASHLIDFLLYERKKGRLPKNLLPIQSGVGSVANAVLYGLLDSSLEGLTFYSEVIQDSVFDLLDSGKMLFASGTSITPSKEGLKRFYNNLKEYKDKIILRPQEISNNPEIIRRLGSISINTAIEADIYGNVNSTNIMGTKMMNGIGGSGDFARNAYLSIFTTPSIAKGGDISSIVPMVSHIDHTEHDIHVIVTEQGVADLRGLSPSEKKDTIIENLSHPDYKLMLREYYKESSRTGKHISHSLNNCLSWHNRFLEKGSMKK